MKSKEVFTIILVRTSLNIEFYFAICAGTAFTAMVTYARVTAMGTIFFEVGYAP